MGNEKDINKKLEQIQNDIYVLGVAILGVILGVNGILAYPERVSSFAFAILGIICLAIALFWFITFKVRDNKED